MTSGQQSAIERPLGATEDMYWRFDSVSPLNFGSIVRLEGVLDVDALRFALRALQQRHPLLRVYIETDGQGVPWFREGTGDIHLQVLDQASGQEWALLETELNTAFDTKSGPLIRCLLIKHNHQESTLITTYHHAICDGKSAIFLLRDIQQSLAQMDVGEAAGLVPLPPVGYYGDRIPSMEHYAENDGLRTAWKTVQASVQFMRRVGLPMGLRNKHEVPLSEQRLIVEPRFLEPELMKRIAKKAKAEKSSVQCVLNAALSLAVAEDSPARFFHATSCTQVLDIRAQLVPNVGEDCGCFVSGATSLHRLHGRTDFWQLTRDIHKRMLETLATPLPFFHPAMHESFARFGRMMGESSMAKFSELIGNLHPEGLSVSNLGQVKIEVENCPVRITEFAFATNTNVLNYFNTSAATFNGRMTWSFSGSSMLGRDRIAIIADRSIDKILDALE
ncbi:MAG: hypothetical protein KUG73_06750 [Pseudomonadales bacterium]|nr:hypothetical protein [Pseudomonadales bacterium]